MASLKERCEHTQDTLRDVLRDDLVNRLPSPHFKGFLMTRFFSCVSTQCVPEMLMDRVLN